MKQQYKSLLKYSAWLSIIVFVILCLINIDTVMYSFSVYDLYEYAGESISFTIIVMILYEKYLWKYNPLNKTPVLKKYYKGEIFSLYDNSKRNVKLEIKQTLLSLSITLITKESKSHSIIASIDDIYNEKQLTYCYINTPKTDYRPRSEIHYGTAMLCINNSNKLEGSYYTDRETRGSMTFYSMAKK